MLFLHPRCCYTTSVAYRSGRLLLLHPVRMSLQQLLRRNIAASVLDDAAGDGGQPVEASGRDMAEARLQGGGGGGGGGEGEKAAGAASPRSERQEAGDRSRRATSSASAGGRSASPSMDERELAATSLSACHVGSPSSRKQATGSDRVGLHPLPLPLPLEPSPCNPNLSPTPRHGRRPPSPSSPWSSRSLPTARGAHGTSTPARRSS